MTVASLFFIFLGLLVLGMLLAVANMALMARSFFRAPVDKVFDKAPRTFVIHALCGIATFVGGLGAFICGVLWLVNAVKG